MIIFSYSLLCSHGMMNCSESLVVLSNKILNSDGAVKTEGSEKESSQALEFLPVNAKLSKG